MKKKLIEVALPLEAINKASAREKSIRHGHPSTLHLWWARRPLAACRAVLFASLVDDPGEETERQRLFKLIEDLVQWENINNQTLLDQARAEILKSTGGNPPPIYDPFCGGGSIPLEAQRLGLEVYATDLNPVAVLITKALIEIPPKFRDNPPVNPQSRKKFKASWPGASGLADDVRYYGAWMRNEAQKRIRHLYPAVTLKDGSEATVIAWLWARTVKCPNPACGMEMPLVRSFSLSTKKDNAVWVEPVIQGGASRASFRIASGQGRAPEGTVGRKGARCLKCGTPVTLDYIRSEGRAGRIGAQLMAIVAEGRRGRIYQEPNEQHERIAASVVPNWTPESNLPEKALGFRVQAYGITRHSDLFTKRQLLALSTFCDLVGEARSQAIADGASTSQADAVITYLALGVSRLSDICNAFCMWENTKTQVRHLFTRQAISMLWDFAEPNIFSQSAGDFGVSLANLIKALEMTPAKGVAHVRQMDATATVPNRVMYSTDPPYYDNIGYADLSDFFYIWLRRCLSSVYPDLFSTLLVPKKQELIAAPDRHGGKEEARAFFEGGFGKAVSQMRTNHDPNYPLTVFYAFKQTESGEDDDDGNAGAVASTGWETMLEGLLKAGFQIDGTWPSRSELGNRMRSFDSNALASSIVLVCRPRLESAPVTTRKDFLIALRRDLPTAVRTLQQGNIAPVDLTASIDWTWYGRVFALPEGS